MSGLKFLITLFVIYLIFRSIMRKVLSAVNTEGAGGLKGKLGDVIDQVKREMERARLEAEREAAGEDDERIMADDPWGVLRRDDEGRPFHEEILEEENAAPGRSHERWGAGDETPSLHERWDAADETPSLHERWDAVDERSSRWDSTEEEGLPCGARQRESVPGMPSGKCRRRRRMRLKEAVVWKEILDRPVGLRP